MEEGETGCGLAEILAQLGGLFGQSLLLCGEFTELLAGLGVCQGVVNGPAIAWAITLKCGKFPLKVDVVVV